MVGMSRGRGRLSDFCERGAGGPECAAKERERVHCARCVDYELHVTGRCGMAVYMKERFAEDRGNVVGVLAPTRQAMPSCRRREIMHL